jgi:hypothetical protein
MLAAALVLYIRACSCGSLAQALPCQWFTAALPRLLRMHNPKLVNRLDTALHIAVLLHGLYVGVIPIWLHWHDQVVGRHGTARC